MASANDKIADAIRKHSVLLSRYTETEQKAIHRRMTQLFLELKKSTAGADFLTGTAKQQQRKMNELFKQAEIEITGTYTKIAEHTQKTLYDLAEFEAQWTAGLLSKNIGVKIGAIGTLTEVQLDAVLSEALIEGAPSSEWWSRQSTKLLNHFKDQMRMGWAKGEGLETLIARLTGGKDAYGNAIFDISKGTYRGAEALVRTSFQAISNKARMGMFRENADVLQGVQWVSTLDDRTSILCASRDSLMWDLDGNPIDHDIEFEEPPIHWNCRSVLSCVTKSFRDLGIDMDDFDGDEDTRASLDGQVPAKMNFEEWIASKPEKFADEVFGKTRADLWRDGKIKVRDMVDQKGRPLTLDELKKNMG